jgi:DNA ligase 1
MLFSKVSQVWTDIENTDGRIEMSRHFSRLLEDVKREELKPLVYLCQGILLPPFRGLELGMGERLVMQSISLVSGQDMKILDKKFKELGDMGLLSQWAIENKKQTSLFSEELELSGVYQALLNLAKMGGKGSQELKIKTLAEILNSADSWQARYICRFCVGKMRLGIAEPSIIDSLAMIRVPLIKKNMWGIKRRLDGHVFRIETLEEQEEENAEASIRLKIRCQDNAIKNIEGEMCSLIYLLNSRDMYVDGLKVSKIRQDKEDYEIYDVLMMGFRKGVRRPIERAYNLCSDLGLVAELSLFEYEKIAEFKIMLFSPIRPALAERLKNPEEIIEKIGPCALEGKYDGFRIQVHKDEDHVELYSRKLERITDSFPEIVEAVIELEPKKIIFEGEALAYNKKEKRYYSFQLTIQRKRKYGIAKMREEFPLRLFAFDLMLLDGVDKTMVPYERRRNELENILKHGQDSIEPSIIKRVDKPEQIENFFTKCLDAGLEGIIAKDLSAPYVAGAREFAWIKLKKSYGNMADTLDVVVVGYYLGEGSRTEYNFGGMLVAVRDEDSGGLQTVAKIGSGFSEEEMAELGEELASLRIKQRPKEIDSKLEPDFWVEPRMVITVSADEISLSSVHTCAKAGEKGYALRFPRMVDIRADKSISDITTASEVERMYSMQKNRAKV